MGRHTVFGGQRPHETEFLKHLLAIIFVGLVATGSTLAVTDHRPAGTFDERVQHRTRGRISLAPVSIDRLEPDDALRIGWGHFVDRYRGGWRVYLDERTGMPAMVSGRGVQLVPETEFPGATLDSLEATLREFLDRHADLLGDWTPVLVLDRTASSRIRDEYWKLVFRQETGGILVEDARLEFHVNRGRLTLFGAVKWAMPDVPIVPTLDSGQAWAVLEHHLEASTVPSSRVETPELTVIPLDAEPSVGGEHEWSGARGAGIEHVLIWRLRFREAGKPHLWTGEVNAHTGEVLAFYDATHYTAVRGGVFPVSNDEDCTDDGCEIDGFPMPFADFTETGQFEEYADPFGNLVCVDDGATFESNLSGPYIHVNDHCGATTETGSCDTGLELGLKNGENCDVRPGSSAGDTAAARSSYYHLNRLAEMTRFYDPGNTWLENQVTVHVNVSGTCNAFWNGDINMYGSGGGCRNTGELQGVTVHEWGHGYDHNDGGGVDNPGEAYADVVAILAARDSCMGRGWFNDGSTCSGYGDACLSCTGIRDLDWAARQNATPVTASNFVVTRCPDNGGLSSPCGREPHCEGYLVGETMFDLATRDLPASGMDQDTAWQLVERLWYESRPGSGGNMYFCIQGTVNSCLATSLYVKLRVADDDDGDLSNGTPHAGALFAAFKRHAMACGSVSDPANQSSSGCPALAAPVLTVAESPGGTELTWPPVSGAAEYRIYRGELGCDRMQIPLASLASGTTSYLDSEADPELPRFYRVEAFGTTTACHSPVSNCESTPVGSRLQLSFYRFVETEPIPNNLPDPGETVQMPVSLFNSGLDLSTAPQGTLRMVDPSQGVLSDMDATWAGILPSQSQESDAPYFEFTVDDAVPCGSILSLELDVTASNANPRTFEITVPMGDPRRDFLNDVDETIPTETTVPVISTIVIDQDHPIAELDVSVRITHALEEELVVELRSPAGTAVRLHDRIDVAGSGINSRFDLERIPDGPGSMDDFIGESTLGTWTLAIEDLGPLSGAPGALREWTLHFTVDSGFDCHPLACGEPVPVDPVSSFQVDKQVNGADLDLVMNWDALAAVAGYRVVQSETATFDIESESGSTAGATTLTLSDGANTAPALTFFEVRGLNSCDQEGP